MKRVKKRKKVVTEKRWAVKFPGEILLVSNYTTKREFVQVVGRHAPLVRVTITYEVPRD